MSEETTIEAERSVYSRRQFMRVAAVATGSTLLAACGGQSTPTPSKIPMVPTVAPGAVTATAQASIGRTYFPSPAPNVPDAYTAPLPPFQSVNFVPGRGGAVKVFAVTYNKPETPKSMNRFWQGLEQRLNVTWNTNFAAGNEIYIEKANTLLASGDLPDLFVIMPAIAPSLVHTIQQGAFTDLTSHLSGSALNDYPNLASFPPVLWKNITINGKIYGVPRPRVITGSALLYRKDWAQKVGMASPPKNANDFYKLMQAFTRGHPNGRADTWGMGFSVTGVFGHQFFMNIFRVPNGWRQEANGSLTYFIQTEEYREAIAFMTKMYADGLFYPGSLTQSGILSTQNFMAGKYGSFLGTFSSLYNQRKALRALNPNADLEVMIPFGADSGNGNHWITGGNLGYTGIPSVAGSDPERVKELLRVLDYFAAPLFSIESNFLTYGIDGWDSTTGSHGVKTLTSVGNNEIGNLTNVTNGPVAYYFPEDPSFGPVMQDYTRRLLAIGVANAAAHLLSPTATRQQGTLESLINDRVVRIIKGTDPVSALDNLIAEWKAQGGAQIAKEYAQALGGSDTPRA